VYAPTPESSLGLWILVAIACRSWAVPVARDVHEPVDAVGFRFAAVTFRLALPVVMVAADGAAVAGEAAVVDLDVFATDIATRGAHAVAVDGFL
jgi:hypothetical protein